MIPNSLQFPWICRIGLSLHDASEYGYEERGAKEAWIYCFILYQIESVIYILSKCDLPWSGYVNRVNI